LVKLDGRSIEKPSTPTTNKDGSSHQLKVIDYAGKLYLWKWLTDFKANPPGILPTQITRCTLSCNH